jgi:hypothetical protein
MATNFLLLSVGQIVGGMSLETFVLRKHFPALYSKSELGTPRSYGAVLFVNVVVSSLTMLTLGFKVSAARKIFKDKVRRFFRTPHDVTPPLPDLYLPTSS